MAETKQDLSKITSIKENGTDDQNYEVEAISKKLLERNLEAYKKLAE